MLKVPYFPFPFPQSEFHFCLLRFSVEWFRFANVIHFIFIPFNIHNFIGLCTVYLMVLQITKCRLWILLKLHSFIIIIICLYHYVAMYIIIPWWQSFLFCRAFILFIWIRTIVMAKGPHPGFCELLGFIYKHVRDSGKGFTSGGGLITCKGILDHVRGIPKVYYTLHRSQDFRKLTTHTFRGRGSTIKTDFLAIHNIHFP